MAAAQAKRKAESELNDARAKAARREQPQAQPTQNGPARPSASSPPSKPGIPSTSSPLPYRGTARLNAAPPSTTKPTAKPSPAASSSSFAVSKPAAPASGTSTTAAKKTGYQAILERGKAAQGVLGGPAIKHKPIERVTKRERLAQEAEAARNKKERKVGLNGRSRSAEPQGAKAAGPQKEKRKPLDLGYKGTMRPAAPESSYKGTMSLNAPKARKPGYESDRGRYGDRSRSTSVGAKPMVKEKGARYAGYASYSENDSEDEEDYESESDMEAAAFDLEEEEQASLLAAKKEDLQALKEENELKRKKLERKKMLEKMAADAAKKKRY